MTGIGVIAGLTCREAARRRVLAAAAVLGGAFLLLYGFGLHMVLASLPAAVARQVRIRPVIPCSARQRLAWAAFHLSGRNSSSRF